MNPVIQLDPTGCALASVAALTGRRYAAVKQAAGAAGITVDDPRLWSRTGPMRRLLRRFGLAAANSETPFTSWDALPDRALLAIKWHRNSTGPAWHWVVFVRDPRACYVLDSNPHLRRHRRTDFGRIKPKWYLRIRPRASG